MCRHTLPARPSPLLLNQQQEVFAKAVETLAELREAALDDLVATVDARKQELEYTCRAGGREP